MAILRRDMRRPATQTVLPAAVALFFAIVACATGDTTVIGITPTAVFTTATPGGSISISLLTPTVTVDGAFNPGAQLIGPVATQTAAAATAQALADNPPTLTPTTVGVYTEPALCPVSSPADLPEESPDFTQYGELFNAFLSQGGASTTLEATLRRWNAVTEFGGLVRADRDFTGDGVPEVLVIAFDPARVEVNPQPGDLFIFGCEDGVYRLLHQAGFALDKGTPVLHWADDINGDFINDLVYSVESCEDLLCFNEVSVVAWSLGLANFENLAAQEIIAPFAQVVVSDANADGVTDISVTTGIIPSEDAGPQRQTTSIYGWDGSLFILSDTIEPITQYRIHMVHDADLALVEERFSEAIALYREAANDRNDLQSWRYPDEGQYLRAYAQMKLMVTHAAAGDAVRAQAAHDALVAAFAPPETPPPPGDDGGNEGGEGDNDDPPPTVTPTATPVVIEEAPGSEFANMAELFWLEWSINRDANIACELVTAYARANPDSFLVLNTFGFANPEYEAEDLCPFSRE